MAVHGDHELVEIRSAVPYQRGDRLILPRRRSRKPWKVLWCKPVDEGWQVTLIGCPCLISAADRPNAVGRRG